MGRLCFYNNKWGFNAVPIIIVDKTTPLLEYTPQPQYHIHGHYMCITSSVFMRQNALSILWMGPITQR